MDSGAFNVLEGNHAVDLAATYRVLAHLDPFVTLTGDTRNLDLAAGFAPHRASGLAPDWVASLENRLRKRLHSGVLSIASNSSSTPGRTVEAGRHQITVLGIGYYGKLRVALCRGLCPLHRAPHPTLAIQLIRGSGTRLTPLYSLPTTTGPPPAAHRSSFRHTSALTICRSIQTSDRASSARANSAPPPAALPTLRRASRSTSRCSQG